MDYTCIKFKYPSSENENSVKEITEFYGSNMHANIVLRPVEQIQKSVDNRSYLCAYNRGQIIGVAGTFDHDINNRVYYELGGTRVLPRGFALQGEMIRIRTLHNYISKGFYSGDQYYSCVYTRNAASIHNLRKAGMVEWVYPDSDLVEFKAKKYPDVDFKGQDVVFYKYDLDYIRVLAQQQLERGKLYKDLTKNCIYDYSGLEIISNPILFASLERFARGNNED